MAVTCLQMICSENMTKSELQEPMNEQVDAQEVPRLRRLPRPKPYPVALIALLVKPLVAGRSNIRVFDERLQLGVT